MPRAALAAALLFLGPAAACTGLVSSDATPVSLVVLAPPDTIQVDDTVDIVVRVLNRAGDTIPGALVTLHSTAPDTIGIDSARVAVIGLRAGSGQVVPFAGPLSGSPFRIVVD